MSGWEYEPDDVQYRVWADIITKWGRPDGIGPDVCDESGGLAIFDDEDNAAQAAHELHEAGAALMRVEPCPWGEHWHVVPA